MKLKLELSLHGGLGDNIGTRIILENIRHKYDQITISHNRGVVNYYRDGNPQYFDFLTQLGELAFDEPPFVLSGTEVTYAPPEVIYKLMQNHPDYFPIVRPNLSRYCQGTPLDLTDYVVLTTKVRCLPKSNLIPLLPSFFSTIAKANKIVLLGERHVEPSKEYVSQNHMIYSLYHEYIQHIPSHKILDLTVPALGITVPNLKQIRQDMLIMQNAKATITFGVGGNFVMSTAVGTTIGYRQDNEFPTTPMADVFCHPAYHPGDTITRDWNTFIKAVQQFTGA